MEPQKVLSVKCWTARGSQRNYTELNRFCPIMRNLRRFCLSMLNHRKFHFPLYGIKKVLSSHTESMKVLSVNSWTFDSSVSDFIESRRFCPLMLNHIKFLLGNDERKRFCSIVRNFRRFCFSMLSHSKFFVGIYETKEVLCDNTEGKNILVNGT
jgi:hypothetical protein